MVTYRFAAIAVFLVIAGAVRMVQFKAFKAQIICLNCLHLLLVSFNIIAFITIVVSPAETAYSSPIVIGVIVIVHIIVRIIVVRVCAPSRTTTASSVVVMTHRVVICIRLLHDLRHYC